MEKKNKCIFLVDDNIVTLNVGKTILQNKYTVVTISSGEKLMQILKKVIPDLILLDIGMPGMSGYDIIKEITSDPETADIPVIFLTGRTETEDEILGFSLGAADYITKPFAPPLLLKKIERQLLFESHKKELYVYKAAIKYTSELLGFSDIEKTEKTEKIEKIQDILIQAADKNILEDVCDAFISEHPYKTAFSHEEIILMMFKECGVEPEPDLIDLFIKLAGKIKEIYEADKK